MYSLAHLRCLVKGHFQIYTGGKNLKLPDFSEIYLKSFALNKEKE